MYEFSSGMLHQIQLPNKQLVLTMLLTLLNVQLVIATCTVQDPLQPLVINVRLVKAPTRTAVLFVFQGRFQPKDSHGVLLVPLGLSIPAEMETFVSHVRKVRMNGFHMVEKSVL